MEKFRLLAEGAHRLWFFFPENFPRSEKVMAFYLATIQRHVTLPFR
jgi:hypothetical protein